jgi:hypothetical protein
MKKLVTLFAITILSATLHAQNDTVPKEQTANIEVYDVVAVYETRRDGRGVIRRYTDIKRGEILNYDESTGVLTFKDVNGRMYSLNSDQYEYFEYDREYKARRKKRTTLYDRKESGFQISAGLSAGLMTVLLDLTPDENYVNSATSGNYVPVCVKVIAGWHLNKKNAFGLTSEVSFLNSTSTHVNIGARFQHIYNPTKNNAFFLPIELKYSNAQAKHQYFSSDTTYINNGNWIYPTSVLTKTTLNSFEISAGQGISFALKNKRSLSVELLLLKQFILSKRFENTLNISPQTDFNIYGAKLSIFMNF